MRRQLYFDFNLKCSIRFCFSWIPLRLNWICRMLSGFHFFSLQYEYIGGIYNIYISDPVTLHKAWANGAVR